MTWLEIFVFKILKQIYYQKSKQQFLFLFFSNFLCTKKFITQKQAQFLSTRHCFISKNIKIFFKSVYFYAKVYLILYPGFETPQPIFPYGPPQNKPFHEAEIVAIFHEPPTPWTACGHPWTNLQPVIFLLFQFESLQRFFEFVADYNLQFNSLFFKRGNINLIAGSD